MVFRQAEMLCIGCTNRSKWMEHGFHKEQRVMTPEFCFDNTSTILFDAIKILRWDSKSGHAQQTTWTPFTS